MGGYLALNLERYAKLQYCFICFIYSKKEKEYDYFSKKVIFLLNFYIHVRGKSYSNQVAPDHAQGARGGCLVLPFGCERRSSGNRGSGGQG